MSVPPGLVGRWEVAYRQYGDATIYAGKSVAGDRAAAEVLASASWQVASLWREMTASAALPWWALAALRAAAEAFEQQARDWHAKAMHGETGSSGRARLSGRQGAELSNSTGGNAGGHRAG